MLIVDDNEDAAEMLADALSALGFVTATAHDGANALLAAQRFKPQIGVLDVGLPVLDGYELAGRLRASNGDLRLIALTGYGQESDKRRATEAGFCHHMTKPVDLKRLVAVLDSVAK